jgi:hypothetical protein
MVSLFSGETHSCLWSGMVGNAGSFCALGKQVSRHLHRGRLSLSGGTGFLLYDEAMVALQWECHQWWEGLVVSAGSSAILAPEEWQSLEPGIHLHVWQWAPASE